MYGKPQRFFFSGEGRRTMKRLSLSVLVAAFMLVVMLAPVGQKDSVWAESAKFYLDRGNSYFKKGQLDQAIADYTKALEINPRLAIAYAQRGNIYNEKGQLDRVLADYNKALEINQKIPYIWGGRGSVYLHKGQYNRAIADSSKALEIHPAYAQSRIDRAKAYFLKKEYDKAWEDVKIGQNRGIRFPPQFIEDLRKASGNHR